MTAFACSDRSSGCPVCFPYPDEVRADAIRREERRKLFSVVVFALLFGVASFGVATLFGWLMESLL